VQQGESREVGAGAGGSVSRRTLVDAQRGSKSATGATGTGRARGRTAAHLAGIGPRRRTDSAKAGEQVALGVGAGALNAGAPTSAWNACVSSSPGISRSAATTSMRLHVAARHRTVDRAAAAQPVDQEPARPRALALEILSGTRWKLPRPRSTSSPGLLGNLERSYCRREHGRVTARRRKVVPAPVRAGGPARPAH
jgi:hypothetical protein